MNLINTKSFDIAIYAKGDRNSSKLALVLPGRCDTKDYPNMRSHVDYLAGKGYFALSFDPPGTWESPGGMGLYCNTNYLKAVDELIEYYGRKPTLLVGHSRGATISMLAGCSNETVTGFISIMGAYTQRVLGDAATKTDIRDDPFEPDKKVEFQLTPSFFEDAAQYNALDGLAKCTKPKLFIMGTSDEVVKEESVMTAFEAAAQPKRLVKIESDHNYRLNPYKIEEINQIFGVFLDHTIMS